MFKRALILAFLLTGALASPLPAQRGEVTPFIGYRWGGEFNGGNYDPTDAAFSDNLSFNSGPEFGLIVNVKIKRNMQLEFVYDRQQTELVWENTRDGTDSTLTDMSVTYIQGGILVQKPYDQWRPFLVITIGASVFDPQGGYDAETRFSGGFALGTKYYFNNRWGLRIQSRLMSTWVWSQGDIFTGPDGNSYTLPSDTYTAQVDLSGGVIIRF